MIRSSVAQATARNGRSSGSGRSRRIAAPSPEAGCRKRRQKTSHHRGGELETRARQNLTIFLQQHIVPSHPEIPLDRMLHDPGADPARSKRRRHDNTWCREPRGVSPRLPATVADGTNFAVDVRHGCAVRATQHRLALGGRKGATEFQTLQQIEVVRQMLTSRRNEQTDRLVATRDDPRPGLGKFAQDTGCGRPALPTISNRE